MNPAADLVRRCADAIRSAAILPAALLAALLAFVYGVVGPTLSPYHIDNPWFASMIHNAAVLGVERDTLLDSPPSRGLAGTVLFGKVFAAASAALYGVAGWSLTASRLVSSAYWAVAAGIWLLVARRLGLSRKGALLFVLMMALTKPFVLSAMVVRPETFILLLSGLAAWSALKGREVAAGFVAMVALETHPAGVVAIAFAGAVTMARRSDPGFGGRLTRFAAGAAGGVVLYAVLHRGHLHALRDVIAHGADPEMGRFFLLSYFARPGAYLSRLIEAPVIVAGIALALAAPVRRGLPGVAWLVLAAGCVAVLPLRGNPHYLVLVLPALMLPIAAAADRADRRSLALAALCLYYVPVYLAAYTLNKDAAPHRAWYPRAIAAAVPDDGRPVLGSPEEWWEFRNRRYHVAESGKERLFADLESYYFIDNPWLFGRYHLQVAPSVRAAADDRSRSTVVGRICFMGDAARVLLITAR